jgi:ribonuclease G
MSGDRGAAPPDVLVDRDGRFLRAATVRPGGGRQRLVDLAVDRDDGGLRSGAIVRGRVVGHLPGGEAAFVAVGGALPGLLANADVRPPRRLSAGETVTVQVKAEAHAGKGPTCTMDVALPGRFLVHVPALTGIVVSKRLGHPPVRGRLAERIRRIVGDLGLPGAGWVARLGAVDAPDGLLATEAEHLALRWRDLASADDPAPTVLDPGPIAPVRLLTERGGRPIGAIRVADPSVLAALRAWCADAAPDLAASIVAEPAGTTPFETADVEDEIAGLLDRRVALPGGGGLVFDRTEALWVIDVNGGDRASALAVDLAAAVEIGRQIRLRNLGGVIVVDFITPDRPADGERVVLALSGAVADDPAATHVYGMSRLGLVEMTRTRRGPPLIDILTTPTDP